METKPLKTNPESRHIINHTWQDNRVVRAEIVCEDNLSFIGKIQDESIDLIVTSPPYNIKKEY